MKNARVLLLSTISVAGVLFAVSAHAQQANEVLQLKEIVIKDLVRGSVANAYGVRAKAPNSMTVIEGEQLNQFSDLSAGDAIRRLPGVTFPGVNRSREIKLRGIGREYTQVLIDGRPLIDGDSSRNFEVDRLPSAMIERIEIIRSPLSNMASLGAAGTVNIITKRQFERKGGGLSLGGGYLTKNGPVGDINGWASGSEGGFRYFLGADYQRRRVNESSSEMSFKGDGKPNGGSDEEQERSFDDYLVTGRFEFDVSEKDTITFAPTYSRSYEKRDQTSFKFEKDQVALKEQSDELRKRTRETYAGYLEWAHEFDDETRSRLFLDLQKGSESTTRDSVKHKFADNKTDLEERENDIDLQRIAPGFVFNNRFGDHKFEAGFGASFSKRDEEENRIKKGNVTPELGRIYNIKEDIYYGYLSDQFSLFGNDEFTAGLRIEHSRTQTTDSSNDDYSVNSTQVNPSLQYKYNINEDLNWRLGVARTLRRPDLRELTPSLTEKDGNLGKPDTRGNPFLKPEKIWGVDTGLDWYLFDEQGILSTNVYARHFDDKIEDSLSKDAQTDRWVKTPENVGNGHLYGVELEARAPLEFLGLENLSVFANATAMKSRLTDERTGQKRRFSDMPNFVSNIGMDYYVPDWKTTFGINLNTTYAYTQNILEVQGVDKIANVRTHFSALNRLDLSARTDITESFSLSLSALNILRTKDKRERTTFDADGAIADKTFIKEPSYSSYYVRASYKW
ncbi:TonB-dependent receptor plug domain-containing protein [Paenochrobactrum sp. BZR 588]|uniref:TonB-dependent receptor plug domain-containing protein n=1 Tax=unclassified Paenochrobactrum TaxID=2639760 RepID=UPI003854DC03